MRLYGIAAQKSLGFSQVCVLASLLVAKVALLCSPAQAMTDRSFTVQDSLEISYIIDAAQTTAIELRDQQPTGSPILSPNGKYVLLVTQKGILESNRLEATIWILDYDAIRNFVLQRSHARPIPVPIAKCEASSNTSVIADVRWLSDSRRVSFLGKNKSPFQRLFISGVGRIQMEAITPAKSYVSEYSIQGDTIAYTTLVIDDENLKVDSDVVNVGKEDILTLLYPLTKNFEDLDEGKLQSYPAKLHIQRNGQEIPSNFKFNHRDLRLFSAPLSLSPDRRFLITIAPVTDIPEYWKNYRPAEDLPFMRLSPDNTYALAEHNPWKASQYVLIDLVRGKISVLVAAPAARGLAYVMPSEAIWSKDSHSAIIVNTFLPIDSQLQLSDSERDARSQDPAVVTVDISSKAIHLVSYIDQRPMTEKKQRQLSDANWGSSQKEIMLSFSDEKDDQAIKSEDRFEFSGGTWIKVPNSDEADSTEVPPIKLSVTESLNRAPTLIGRANEKSSTVVIWDPNPQLNDLSLGSASIYRWNDHAGRKREGILVLPSNYNPKLKYPLVIQTHGFNRDRFFADGKFTTGSGGQALVAKDVIVFQMDMPLTYYSDPRDGEFAMDGLRSLIERLSSAGLVNPQKVGIVGFSYTCFHVLYAITHYPDMFAAAAITDGNNMSYVQYVMTLSPEKTVAQDDLEQTYGGVPFGESLQSWLKDAPGFNLDRVQTPLLIVSLERGELIGQWETFSLLRRLNKPVHMIWFKSERAPHILVKPRERFISQQSAVDWFNFWLNGREDSNPTDVSDFLSWRQLRRLDSKPIQ